MKRLVLVALLGCGCAQMGNVWQVIGKVLDTVNTVRTTVDTLRDAGASSGGAAGDASP